MRENKWNRPWTVSQSLLESTFVWWKTLFHLIPGRMHVGNWKRVFPFCWCCLHRRSNGYVPGLWHIDVPTWIPLQFPLQIHCIFCPSLWQAHTTQSQIAWCWNITKKCSDCCQTMSPCLWLSYHAAIQSKTLNYAFHTWQVTWHTYTDTAKQQTTNPIMDRTYIPQASWTKWKGM